VSPRDIVGSLHKAALSAAKRQAGAAGFAYGLAKGVVSRGTALAESLLPGRQSPTGREHVEVSEPADRSAGESAESSPDATATSGTAPERSGPDTSAGDEDAAGQEPDRERDQGQDQEPAAPPEPQVVLREPAPPAEPPIDIVGQVLAAEEEDRPVGGRAGEPKGASRDESHGDATMQRAELEEIAEEVAEASPEGDLDLETPVGTTGADVGHNPDTAEADLQQPGTESLVDPATTKSVASEQETLSKASRARKKG
jgi:hypothetical protein